MSEKVVRLLKLGAVATMDLVAGSASAFLLNNVFYADPSDFSYGQLLTRVVLRSFLSVWMGEEVRSLMYSYDFEDPTNGALFMFGLLNGQNQLCKDSKLLVVKSIDKFFSLPFFGYLPTAVTTMAETRVEEKPAESKLGQAANTAVNLLEKWASN